MLEAKTALVYSRGVSQQSPISQEELDEALWHGCNGGHVRAVKLLLARGATRNGKPDYVGCQSHVDAARSLGTQREHLVGFLQSLL